MNSKIKTTHEEAFSRENGNRTLGILSNFSEDWSDSFVYTYKEGMYIFFNTIIEMIDYLLYGEKKMKRAYMVEADFDALYDAKHINGKFEDHLKWVTN